LYKRLVSVLLLLVFCFTLSGCSLFAAKTTKKTMPTDAEVLEEVTEGKVDSTVTKENEDQLELKHLKKAKPAAENKTTAPATQTAKTNPVNESQEANETSAQPPSNQDSASVSAEYKPDYRIHFISEEEAKLTNEKLIKLGYLKEPAKNAKEFADAVYHFQQVEKIPGSGDINPETFERLRSK